MPACIELHDSIVQTYSDIEGRVTVRIAPAILHRSEGRPGVDAGAVYSLSIDLIFQNGNIEAPFAELPSALWEGSFEVGDESFDNLVPYPCDMNGSVSFRCVECAGNTAVVTGTSISIIPASKEVFVENFPGTD